MLFHRFGIYDVAYWDLGQARLISQIGNKVKPLWQTPSRTKRKGRLFGVGPSPCGSRAWRSRKPTPNGGIASSCKSGASHKGFRMNSVECRREHYSLEQHTVRKCELSDL